MNTPGACRECERRAWLLAALSGPLDYCARDRGRLLELLALDDRELLAAVAGRRRDRLADAYGRYVARERSNPHASADLHGAPTRERSRYDSTCRHHKSWPRALCERGAPHLLELGGGIDRFARLAAAPCVSIVGSRAPSDYGVEMAADLARGLAASGVSVIASLDDGIAAAAHLGALELGAPSIAVAGDGLGVARAAQLRRMYERVTRTGCAVCELPHDCSGRRWGGLAAERIIAELGAVTVVVEAEHTPGNLFAAHIARELGRTVAALPGRVTSPLSRGTHALLKEGAQLVSAPADVLELLFAADARDPHAQMPPAPEREPHAGLPEDLRVTLARVGAGCDTPDKLAHGDAGDAARILMALSELELLGLLARGDGGRYVPRQPAT